MWGSSFADLARKAQELQDQAASTVTSSQGLFNLDAMQSSLTGIVEQPSKEEKEANSSGVVEPETSVEGMVEEKSRPVSNGTLDDEKEREPNKSNASPSTAALDANTETILDENPQEEGWEEEEDAEIEDVHLEGPEPPANNKEGANVGEVQEKEATPAVVADKPNHIGEDEKLPMSDVESKEQRGVPEQSKENGQEESMRDETPAVQPAAAATMDREEPKAPIQPISLPSTPTAEKSQPMLATPSSTTESDDRQKLIILISSMPMNRQVQVHQEMALTVLKSNSIDFEVLDGVEEKDLRNELFTISGRRGEYPQFFLVNLAQGGTTFWGGWDDFHSANENGDITTVFPGTMPTSPDVTADKEGKSAAPTTDDTVLEQFAEQIKRIEENHQAELAALEREHVKALAEVGNHKEKLEALREEMETRFGQQIQAKEDQIQELCRRNEGYRLKLDVLKREVTGTQEMLQKKDSTAGKVSQQHLTELRNMEKKVVQAEENASQLNEQCQKLQTTLIETKNELASSRKEHGDLKERVKVVATELKDRRAECRELNAKIEAMETEHQNLQNEIESLKDQLSHQGLNQTEKDGEMDLLRSQLEEANEAHKQAEEEWKQAVMRHEQALADYKKKAQHSLSMANSRTAAAVQAREEAELDARAARSTADSAFERAAAAELASRAAVAESKAALQAMEQERNEANRQMKLADDSRLKIADELSTIQAKLEKAIASRDEKGAELESIRSELRSEQGQIVSLRHQLQEMESSKKKLQGEIETLRIQLEGTQRALDAVDKTKDSDQHPDTFSQKSDDGALAALRQELLEANESIQYLKDALKNAVEMNEKSAEISTETAQNTERSEDPNDGLPLFYAMEKQAELKTARGEINRLANELANIQSEKAEAIEAMDDMRRRMEESESKLKRFEKLSGADDGEASKQNGVETTQGARATNIEYLKHIMLKYITAKTAGERKALVPVIGAVLELTSDEISRALSSAEQSAASSSSFFGF